MTTKKALIPGIVISSIRSHSFDILLTSSSRPDIGGVSMHLIGISVSPPSQQPSL